MYANNTEKSSSSSKPLVDDDDDETACDRRPNTGSLVLPACTPPESAIPRRTLKRVRASLRTTDMTSDVAQSLEDIVQQFRFRKR